MTEGNAMDYNDIQKLVKLIEDSSVDELDYRNESERIRIRKNAPVVMQQAYPVQGAAGNFSDAAVQNAKTVQDGNDVKEAAPEDILKDDSIVDVCAPSVGTVSLNDYETGNQIVKPGDKVKNQDRICMLEAMKMYMDIAAPVDGTVVSIEVKNGEIVEYGQLIARIKKDS